MSAKPTGVVLSIDETELVKTWCRANKIRYRQLAEMIGEQHGTIANVMNGCSRLNRESYAELVRLVKGQ